MVREARPADAAEVWAAYDAGIRARIATFETVTPSPAALAERIAGTVPPYAFLVAPGGWAATFPYSSRAAYDGVAGFSVYLLPEARGQGLGRLLLTELLHRSEQQGLHKLTSMVFTDNSPSLRLCAAVGFREVGVHLRHGRLDGVWKDCVVVEALLGAARQ